MYSNPSYQDLAGYYDRLAPAYDRRHRRWLRHAGGEAQAALEATVRVLAVPGLDLLDAGCGTGAFARRLVAEGQVGLNLTLLDPSEAMLDRCADIPADRVNGRLEQLPFQSARFDIVTCAWALETAACIDTALAELHRIVRPGGVLCLAFCAEKPAFGLGDRVMKFALTQRGAGRFLAVDAVATMLETRYGMDVRALPCRGPAAALVARRTGRSVFLSLCDQPKHRRPR
jgi:SAM-dependent methyltransferase